MEEEQIFKSLFACSEIPALIIPMWSHMFSLVKTLENKQVEMNSGAEVSTGKSMRINGAAQM